MKNPISLLTAGRYTSLSGHELGTVYPRLVETFDAMIARIGLRLPVELHVSRDVTLASPGLAHFNLLGGKIFVSPEIAAMGDSPVARGVLGHELAHIITGKMQPSALHSLHTIRTYRAVEEEMDRLAVPIVGGHDMFEAREWLRNGGARGVSDLLHTTVLARSSGALKQHITEPACEALGKWAHDITQGGSTARQTILSQNPNDLSHVERYVESCHRGMENMRALQERFTR